MGAQVGLYRVCMGWMGHSGGVWGHGASWGCIECIWGILRVYGPVWSILGVYEASEGIWGYGASWGCIGCIWGILGVYGTVWGILGLYGGTGVRWGCTEYIRGMLGVYGAVLGYMGSYGASWDSMGAQRASWGCMGGIWGILGVYGGTGVKLRLYRVYMGHGGGMYSCVEHPGAVQRVLMYNLDVHVASWGCTEHIQCILHVYQASLGCIEGI